MFDQAAAAISGMSCRCHLSADIEAITLHCMLLLIDLFIGDICMIKTGIIDIHRYFVVAL